MPLTGSVRFYCKSMELSKWSENNEKGMPYPSADDVGGAVDAVEAVDAMGVRMCWWDHTRPYTSTQQSI